MTTRKPRRNKQQQASDILKTLLKDQEAEVDSLTRKLNTAVAERDRTKRMLEMLGQEMLPGMEAVPLSNAFPNNIPNAEMEPVPPIGKKARAIDDVWNQKEGSVEVHSLLMYIRDTHCEWCMRGVPFATAKRTEHYIVTRDKTGTERGFEYKPCTGIGVA